MKKEEIVALGVDEEIAQKIADASAEELKGYIPKSRFDEVNEAKKNAEALVKERDGQLETLKKSAGNSEDLQKQIEDLQKANKTAVAEYEGKIKQMRIDNAVAPFTFTSRSPLNLAIRMEKEVRGTSAGTSLETLPKT